MNQIYVFLMKGRVEVKAPLTDVAEDCLGPGQASSHLQSEPDPNELSAAALFFALDSRL
jgi:hypothetical protein